MTKPAARAAAVRSNWGLPRLARRLQAERLVGQAGSARRRWSVSGERCLGWLFVGLLWLALVPLASAEQQPAESAKLPTPSSALEFLAQTPSASAAQASTPTSQSVTVALLGVIQGLTEFLPVSSSGHLTLAKAAFGFESISGPLLIVALHVGTLFAVLWVYRLDVLGLLREARRRRLRPLALLFVGSLPAGLVGVGFKDQLEALFERPEFAAGCLLFTALLLLVSDFYQRRQAAPAPQDPLRVDPSGIASLSYRQALTIGVMQAVAILPGVSRSGSTIATGLLVGLDAARAARFSFLLSLPAVGGATLLEALEFSSGSGQGAGLLLMGMAVSAVVGLASLKLLLLVLRRGAFRWFALYCALLGGGWLLFGPATAS